MKATDEGSVVRELDHRGANGIEVSLLWDPLTSNVLVAVVEDATGVQFEFDVDPADALDAFRHPYAYVRMGGSECRTLEGRLALLAGTDTAGSLVDVEEHEVRRGKGAT